MKKPKASGYKSYHMIVSLPVFLSDRQVDVKVEIQIRTIAMDFWASLEHKIYYKFEGNAPDYISRDLRECSEIVSNLDARMLHLNEAIMAVKEEAREEREKILIKFVFFSYNLLNNARYNGRILLYTKNNVSDGVQRDNTVGK